MENTHKKELTFKNTTYQDLKEIVTIKKKKTILNLQNGFPINKKYQNRILFFYKP